MRLLHAAAASLMIAAFAVPSSAQDHGLNGEFVSPLPSAVTSIDVAFAEGIVSDSLIYRRYRNPNAISTRDAKKLKERLEASLNQELTSHGLFATSANGSGLKLSVTVVAIAPSDPGLTGIGFKMGVDAGSLARGGAALSAELRDRRGALVGTFIYSGRDDWAGAHSKSSQAWKAAESTFDRFAYHLADVLAAEGGSPAT